MYIYIQQKAKYMPEIYGTDRHQITFSSLEDRIAPDNIVRFIDAFVEQIDLAKIGVVLSTTKVEGRPRFLEKYFLKLYLYGYINGIRSSRRLAKECVRNIEVQWLMQETMPNYHSIADFRKDNPIALRNLFKLYVLFLKDVSLIGGKEVAIDGTKSRASNSKKNNYNQKKIDRHLAYIDVKTHEYLSELESNDSEEQRIEQKLALEQKLAHLQSNKLKYEYLEKQLQQSGEPQVSTTDADARALLVQGQVVEVAYNIEAAVDGKHKLVIGTHTINRNDRNALHAIAKEAKENIGAEALTVIADKGYHNGRQLQQCADDDITTIVAQQEIVNSNDHGTTAEYLVTQFVYDVETDTYRCPAGETLTTKGTWHTKAREHSPYRYKKYRTAQCKSCPVKHLCTGRAKGGREIERSEFAEVVEANAQRYHANKALYRKRQEWNEHIFGTIKRQWGYYYTNLRGLEKVNGEHSLIMLVYNIKRSINLLGMPKILETIKNWTPKYPKGFFEIKNALIRAILSLFKPYEKNENKIASQLAA